MKSEVWIAPEGYLVVFERVDNGLGATVWRAYSGTWFSESISKAFAAAWMKQRGYKRLGLL